MVSDAIASGLYVVFTGLFTGPNLRWFNPIPPIGQRLADMNGLLRLPGAI